MPMLHTSPLPQWPPHAPQLFGSVFMLTHVEPPHFGHSQVPSAQTVPGMRVAQYLFAGDGSSTIPLQSSSNPLQISGACAHWQSPPPHVQPATHASAAVHCDEQTLPLPAPVGTQMLVTHSVYVLHGLPVPSLGALWHVPSRQTREPSHAGESAQHAWSVAPQDGASGPASPTA